MSRNQQPNPYASAAGAYGNNAQKSAADPRELEARVLMKSNQNLVDAQNRWDTLGKDALEETLKYNRNIWMMFYDTAIENKSDEQQRPDDLRSNIYNLANFIFKRELDILAKPARNKLDILISINKEIAAGLLAGARAAASQAKAGSASAPVADTQPLSGHNQSV